MKKNIFILFTFFFSLNFIGCSGPAEKISEKTQEFERVFMHEPGDYSFMFFESNSPKELKTCRYNTYYGGILKIFPDVSIGNKSWFYIATYRDKMGTNKNVLIIHLKDSKEIQSGGWDHGKFGRGQTMVLE